MVMGSLQQEADLVVVGGGPGGYVAAIRAADLGREVVLVEQRAQLGGTCLLEGCIPSKTLIHAVGLLHQAREARRIGLTFADPDVDLSAMRRWTDEVVGGLSQGVDQLLRRRGVEVIGARARFDSPTSLALEGGDVSGLSFRNAIVATGSTPMRVAAAEAPGVWTSTEALDLPSVPDRLVVIGGGYIGLELGLVYAGLGSRVEVVDFSPRLLAGADPDLVRTMMRTAEPRLAAVHRETRVIAVRGEPGAYLTEVERDGSRASLESEAVLVCVGRRPATGELGLDAAGVQVNSRGFVPVDEACRTNVPTIQAIGDVTPGPMLAHKASREAHVAAEVLAGEPSAFDNRAIPAVVFTDPEIAWVGLTETEAKRDGVAVDVGRFPLTALGRARALGRTDGLVKVLSQPGSGLILGAGLVGVGASELVGEMALALEMGATTEDLAVTIHPHPTLSESLMEAAEVASGAPIHVLPRR